MNIEEYKKRKSDLSNQFEIDKKNLAIEFVRKNTLYKIGDIISDKYSNESLKIESIVTYLDYNTPEPLYKGTLVKKDGTLFKTTRKNQMLQSRVKIFNIKKP